ncbi:epoxide hydrolase family protein [Tengunoibacter tsumagoiensis]|uniref:Multidrug MFS transporter n=1 Tax=Tengunoibacter tsumagoiensis TaxID=2014871 RepID=A0A402A9H1_9CHLR|nr:epoxide hydrolase family protein [Tengunoibacter tsumagoiensis]GCE15605.1 multidrug MFS transporter [Tengunoibacter tsumagoiensis]
MCQEGKYPFRIAIPQAVLDDLKMRLERTRWPDEIENAGWDYGTNQEYLRSLMNYWQHEFDWRAQEAQLNQWTHFRADLSGLNIHFLYERGQGPRPLPLILTHGWPSSFFEMYKLLPLLTNPVAYGGDPADSFDVIVPSLPGFGFSDRPGTRGVSTSEVAELWASLMTDVLGYTHFAAAGGDIGAGVTQRLALKYPEQLIGIHLNYLGASATPLDPIELSDAERRYLREIEQWSVNEGAYAKLHATKPQTLAYALNDSPVGLAAWIVEKFRAWSDCAGDVERRFSKDELLTNIMLYWATETISSSMRIYYENRRALSPLKPGQKIEVPAGIACFPKEISQPPREWAERTLYVQRWTQMPRGGHFAALEEPALLAEELRAFFRPFRRNGA